MNRQKLNRLNKLAEKIGNGNQEETNQAFEEMMGIYKNEFRLIISFWAQRKNYSLDRDDLIQIASLTLFQTAIKWNNSNRGRDFACYVNPAIRAALIRATSEDAPIRVASVNELNTYFTNAISYAGYIVVALGIISLILAFAESSMNSKARGSMLVAGGAIMVSFAAVMDKLRIGTDSTGASVAKKTLTMIGTGMTLVGGILLAYSVIQYIMAFIHSTADESANASKGLAVGIAFSCGGGIMKGLKGILASNSHGTTRIVKYVVYQVIANAATYVGVGMILYGIINYLLAYRDENVESKMKASIYFAIGLGLTSARVIIHSVTKLGYYK